MRRRDFLKALPVLAAGTAEWSRATSGKAQGGLLYATSNRRWQAAYDAAMQVLADNVQVLPRFDGPVLIEGASYQGVWQECGPHESLVYRHVRKDVARNTHRTFFALQREDGQIPANNKRSETGFGQIQMVVPIAATAWELARATGDDQLLQEAYASCSRWDAWLRKYRDTRASGLVEGFCTYDTGHDNSPRWKGIPPQCPGKDAKRFPPIASLPRLCPDLSATVYGARVALAAMAKALGKREEAEEWEASAEKIQRLILEKLYVADDAAFYDLDATGRFVKVRCDILTRVCGEHVVDQKLFDTLWEKQLYRKSAFWTPYPLPSVAADDPEFVRPIPRNSWGGASQALTALRAIRWFDHYGRAAEFRYMMGQWCEALQRDSSFRQQMDPLSGTFTAEGEPRYSPAALVLMEYTWRLAGVCEESETLYWNVVADHPAADGATFRRVLDTGKVACLSHANRRPALTLNGRSVFQWEAGAARLVTDKSGRPLSLWGIADAVQNVRLRILGHGVLTIRLMPNQQVPIR